MNQNSNNTHKHGKEKRKRSRHNKHFGMAIAIFAIILAAGWMWMMPKLFESKDKPAAASGQSDSTSSQMSDEASDIMGSSSSESQGENTSEPTKADSQAASQTPETTDDLMKNINVTWDTTGIEGYDYLVAINRAADCVTVYKKDENNNYLVPFKAMVCSTGEDTPLGEYRTIEQYRWRFLFGDVYGQYAVRIVGHILFHSVPYLSQNPADLEYEEFNKLGTPASMGCIRLQVADVKWIYDNCPLGTPVVLYDDAENPGPLGKPSFTPVDVNDEKTRGWDPTDPDPNNPWHKEAITNH